MLLECLAFIPRPVVALAGSVVLGAAFTLVSAEMLHNSLEGTFPNIAAAGPSRVRWIGAMIGALHRGLLTTLVIWLPAATGPVAGALLAVHAILGWGGVDSQTLPGRARYNISMTNQMVSIFWAIAWGIWGIPTKPI